MREWRDREKKERRQGEGGLQCALIIVYVHV